MNYRNKKILTLKSIFIMLLMVLFIMPLNAKAVSVGDTYSYGYKNSIQTFTAPVTGYYRLETWGAQGGSYGSYRGGYGAYATGVVFLNKNDTLYIVTGGQPGVASNSSIGGGYNGGGSARTQSGNDKAGGGGGATHIATRSGLLSSLNSYHSEVLIVSAGGGGGYYYPSFNSIGGEGGGISGGVAPNGTCSGRTLIKGSAATQTGAGSSNGCGGDYRSLRGGFGYGHGGTNWQSGGGSGWFGGGSGMAHGGNGGSSYIGNSRLLSRNGVTKAMYCYSCSASSTASTYTVSTTSVSSTPTSNAAKSGSGAAKISILEIHNTDARIKEVNISGTNFSDVFDPDTYIYNFAIDPENSEVTITSSPMNALTTIVGNNSYTLPVGVTSVILTSTSESGNVLIYKINLTRAASGYQYLKDIKIGGNSLEDFEPTKLVYNIDVPYNTTTLDVDAIKGRMGQQVYFPPNLTINSGVNHFEIIVISEDGQKQTIYTLNVTKPHNSKLKSLSLKNATTSFELEPSFNSDTLEYSVSVMSSTLAVDVTAIPYDEEAKVKLEGFGYIKSNTTAKITVTEPNCAPTVYTIKITKEGTASKETYDFPYRGKTETFVAPVTGYYQLETWGAQGGSYGGYRGGYGAYSTGAVFLNKGDILYVTVGGQPGVASNSSISGGYNGGGKARTQSGNDKAGGGGGATHISTKTGLLSSLNASREQILIVSAGGGGGYYYPKFNSIGGEGGGVTGGVAPRGTCSGRSLYIGSAATQSAGGTNNGCGAREGANGSFGLGSNGSNWQSGGGAGWNGGGNGFAHGGNGGSSYIGNSKLVSYKEVTKSMYCFSCATSNAESTYTVSTSKVSSTPSSYAAKSGSGYARITILPQPSENNFLSSITVKATNYITTNLVPKTYTPDFSLEVQDYYVTLDPIETSITLAAKPEDSTAKIDGLGKFDVPAGTTDFPITVTAESGDQRIYTVHVTRPASSDQYPLDITINGLVPSLCSLANEDFCKLNPAQFDKDTNTYYLTVPYRIKQLYFSVHKGHPNQVVTGEGKAILKGGENNFVIEVTSEDGTNTSQYQYVVTRDMTGNTDIELEILDPEKNINFDPDISEYYITVDNNYKKFTYVDGNKDGNKDKPPADLKDDILSSQMDTIQLYIKTDDENATFTVDGPGELVTGMNQIKITVTGASGEIFIYVLNVYRSKNENVFLSTLEVLDTTNTSYTIQPEFNKANTGPYKVTVPNEISEVTIQATAEAPTSTVTGIGKKVLSVGENRYNLHVTAENGTVETYTVLITREKNNNPNLSNITVKNGEKNYTLTPNFDPATIEYEITVEEGVSQITIEATPEVATTTYKLLDNTNIKAGENIKRVMGIAEDGTTKIYTIKITRPASSNNYLSDLIVKNEEKEFELTPVFDKTTEQYTLEVENEISYVNVIGVKENPLSTISGEGKHALVVGVNEIEVSVVAENGDHKVYTIQITRKANSNAYLSDIRTSAGTLEPVFEKETLSYTMNVESTISKIQITGIPEVKTTEVTGSKEYALVSGNNRIELVTLAEDGVSTLTYIINIEKKQSDNNYLSYLVLEEATISPTFTKEETSYRAVVPYEIQSGVFHVQTEDPNATYQILNNGPFIVGENEVTIEVTSESGLVRNYVITIVRQEDFSNSDYLSLLAVDQGTLDPEFKKDQLYYEVEVPNNITKINVTATPEDRHATVTGDGEYPLNVGTNFIAVKVTSTENKTREYQIIVTRKESSEARLSELAVQGSTLNPIFNRDVTSYQLETTEQKLTFSKIKTLDENATYNIIGNQMADIGVYTVIIRVTAADQVTQKDYELTVTRKESNNNNLADLRVVDYQISPEFKKTTTLYNLTVGNDVNSIVIEAIPEYKTSTVSGDGLQLLVVGENQFVIEVVSESGQKKVYTLIVTKEGSSNNKVRDLIVNNGTMTPTYDPDTYEYDVLVEYEEDSLDLTVILESDKASYQIMDNQLEVGNNQVQVIVTAENGSTQIYKLNVVRKEIVSALLENIIVKDYQLSPVFNSYVNNYSILVNNEVESLDLTVIPLDKKATYQISGNQDFIVGNNIVVIEVTASDGVTKETYTLNVTRQAYANTFLDYLYTSEGDLVPPFQKELLEYSIDVAYSVTEIELIGELSDKSSTVTGLGIHPLNTGTNILEVKVTATNGSIRTYRITVNRDRNEDNFLLNLEAKVGAINYDLNPEFEKNTLEYSVTVPEGTPTINLTGTLSSDTATVTGLGMHTLKAGETKINIMVTSESGKVRTYVVTVTRTASNNNHLIELIPSVGELEPDFSYEETNYTINLDSSAALLSFNAITEDPSATISGLESKVIPDGTSTRTITVTAEDGSERVYTITINKERTDNARLSHLSVTGYPFDIAFDPEIYDYKITVPNTKQILLSSEVNATAEDPNATITKNGNVNLSTTGTNEYVVTVTAPDGFTKQSYTIVIEREKGNNTLLNSLTVHKGTLETPFNPSVFEYNWIVPRNIALGPADVTAIAQDINATIEKTQYVVPSLTEKNQYIVKVIAEDGSSFTEYILNLVVDVSSDASLANLEIDKGYYLPTFDPNTKTYDVYEYVDTTEITITATPTMETATVTSGNGLLALTSDEMTHTIVVTAEDGTEETYTLNIHRTILRDEGLKNLGLNGLEDMECSTTICVLSPVFTTEVLNYKIQVPYEYTNLDILVETMNEQQTVKYRIGEQYITTYELPVGVTTVIVEVYDGMNQKTREYTLVIDRERSRNNNLASLEVVGYELDPEFNKSILEYTVEIPSEIEEVEIKAIPEDKNAQVSINGYNYLEDGENEATVVVTAPNGAEKTYIIHIIRNPKYNSYLKTITISTGIFWELEPDFKPTQFEYTTTITGAATKVTIEAVPVDPTTKVAGTGEFELVTGINNFEIVATASDGSTSVYKITVVKETSRNVNLSNLIVEEGELSPKFEKGTTNYEVTVDSTVDQLTIHAILEDKTSSYVITGNEHLVTGDNKVSIIVMNSDKTVSKTYQLTVHKRPSNNANLSNITVKDDATVYPLTPEFNKDTHTYTVEVPHSTEKVMIEATPENNNALVVGTGEDYLSYGLNERTITVTAEDGTVNMYKVQVYRNYNLDLNDIISDVGELKPEFDKDQLNYKISLPYQEDKISILALRASNLVEVTGSGDYELKAGDNTIELVVTAPDGKTKTYTVTVNRGESDNNFIESLLVHEGVLSPVFNKNTNQYEVEVVNGLSSVGLDITLEDPKATYQVLGNENLQEGPNTVTIRVTAENKDTRDYTINVIVQAASQFSNRLLNISITDGTLSPTFEPDKHYYTANVSNTIAETTIEVVKENVDARVIGIGRVTLEVGRNVFQVQVISKDGFVNTYTLIINRAAASDATLSDLVVTDQKFMPIFNKLVENYQMTVGGDVLDLNVIATPTDPNATVKITGDKNLKTGENTVTILVTAPDGITEKTYTITVNRGISTNNYLTSLTVNGFTYAPEFNKTNSGPYTLDVESTVNSVMIEAIPEIATTIVTGDGKHNLNPGQNIISVQATSESGNVRVYTIIINKLQNSDSTLRDIILSDGELNPEFDPSTLSYTVTVDKTITDILISGVPTEMTSTVSGNGLYSLADGGKEVELVVTSASGTKTTYRVKIEVEGQEEYSSLLADLVVKEGRLQPEFNKNQKDYIIRVPYEVTSLEDMEITPEDPLATYQVEGNQNFIIGTNPVKITVTNQDQSASTIYTIQVIRQKNASNYLTDLSVDGYQMTPAFNKTTLYYEVEVPNEIDQVNIRAILEDPTSRVIGDGPQNLAYGKNRFYVEVTSASGVLRTYSIVITRSMDTGNLLLTLDPSVGTLDKVFEPTVNEYTLTLPTDQTSVTLNGTVSPNATVTGLGTVTMSGTRVEHTIQVTSQSGVVNIYKIAIVYPLSPDTELISLTPSVGTLEYSNDITEYEMEVEESASVLSFTAVPKDPNATVTGCDLTTLNYGENIVTITVTSADGSATRTITIKVTRKKDLIAIIPDQTDIILTKDEVKQVTYVLDPVDTSYTEVEWISSDTDIATVDQDGNITGVKEGATTVQIKSKHNENIIATINVNVINTRITSSVYDCSHDTEVEYVIGAEPSTLLKDFIPNFDNNPSTLHVYRETGEEITDEEEIIGSFMVIKLIIDGKTYDELVIAVRGDLDGDGLVTAADRVAVKNCILGKKESTFMNVKIADIDLDDVITAADGVAVKNYMLGRGQLNDRVKEEEEES